MKKVFVASKLEESGLKKLAANKGIKLCHIPKPTDVELAENISDADAIVIKSNVKLTAEVLEHAKNLKIICRAGAGVDNVDLKKATEKGIPVTNTPGLNSNSVAEQVFSYVHVHFKNLLSYDRSTKEGRWEKGKFRINELRGKKIGIGGFGAIGRRVLEKARGYGMKIVVYDPYISKTIIEDLGGELVDHADKLFTTCDIVTLHMPATPETSGMVTKDLLCKMKDNAIFVNTARSKLMAPGALEGAMKSHKTLRAGMDVFEVEKPGDQLLAKFGDRMVMSPHSAGNSVEGQNEIAELIAEMVIEALLSNRLRNLVNFVKIPENLDSGSMELAEALGHTAAIMLKGKGQLEEIRVSGYSKMSQFVDILSKSAIKGTLFKLVDEDITLINAEAVAKEKGIKITLREPDNSKGYGDSITVDAVVKNKKKYLEASVRGKLVEGEPTIFRIDGFQELGILPKGNQSFFVYKDMPGVIGRIATLLGKKKVNIESLRARTQEKGRDQFLAVRTTQVVPSKLMDKICEDLKSSLKCKVSFAASISY